MIRAHLWDLEDSYAADEGMRAVEDCGRKSRPFDELLADLGLTDSDLAGLDPPVQRRIAAYPLDLSGLPEP